MQNNSELLNSINNDWTECRISDGERLDALEKHFPTKFNKKDFLSTLEHAAKESEPTRVKADKNLIFGQKSTAKALSPDVKPTQTPHIAVLPKK